MKTHNEQLPGFGNQVTVTVSENAAENAGLEGQVTETNGYRLPANPLQDKEVTGNRKTPIRARARTHGKIFAVTVKEAVLDAAQRIGFDPKPEQLEAALCLSDPDAPKDVLAVMPTGRGKTLPPQLVAAQGLPVLAVMPLLALSKDQCDRANAVGLRAFSWNSSLGVKAKRATVAALESGEWDMLFTTPESLRARDLQGLLSGQPWLAWIDEGDVAVQDHNFRPAWGRVGQIIDRVRPRVRYCCTATLAPGHQQELIGRAGLKAPHIIRLSPDRPNLAFAHIEHNAMAIRDVLIRHKGERIIVYTATVKSANNLVDQFSNWGFKATTYNGQMAAGRRRTIQADFKSGKAKVVFATDAFGRGIDVPDIRAIVCFDPADSVAAFVQQAGRAGRDGKPSTIYLASKNCKDGWKTRSYLIESTFPPIRDLELVWHWLKMCGTEGTDRSQKEVCRLAGVEKNLSSGYIFTRLKGKGLAVEEHDESRNYRWWAAGEFNAVDWLGYNAEKPKALGRLEELKRMWALPADLIPQAILSHFETKEGAQ